jgi:hypothetical protein
MHDIGNLEVRELVSDVIKPPPPIPQVWINLDRKPAPPPPTDTLNCEYLTPNIALGKTRTKQKTVDAWNL